MHYNISTPFSMRHFLHTNLSGITISVPCWRNIKTGTCLLQRLQRTGSEDSVTYSLSSVGLSNTRFCADCLFIISISDHFIFPCFCNHRRNASLIPSPVAMFFSTHVPLNFRYKSSSMSRIVVDIVLILHLLQVITVTYISMGVTIVTVVTKNHNIHNKGAT